MQEAREIFGQALNDPRLKLSTTVKTIDYSGDKIVVTTTNGDKYAAPHVVSTFSVGVLQHQDVSFVPRLPDWKKEAIFTFAMATYQKIFLLFEKQFWGDSEVGPCGAVEHNHWVPSPLVLRWPPITMDKLS